jgi:hypothetical protein
MDDLTDLVLLLLQEARGDAVSINEQTLLSECGDLDSLVWLEIMVRVFPRHRELPPDVYPAQADAGAATVRDLCYYWSRWISSE